MKIYLYLKREILNPMAFEIGSLINRFTEKRNAVPYFVKCIGFFVLLMCFSAVKAQESKVLIKVTDGDGNPIERASLELLSVPDSKINTDHNGEGSFSSKVQGLLRITYQDMVKVIKLDGQQVNVKLGEVDRKLEMGFATQKRRDQVAASTDVVYADLLSKSSLNNPAESLYGRLTGLTVMQSNGNPLQRTPDMFIRGMSTFGNNAMLVLVDGFERDLSDLALAEIESVTVLKDAASLAIYGQRGANGVLLVTTKRGELDSFDIDVSFTKGVYQPFRMPKFLDSYNYALAVNQASELDGDEPVYSSWDLQDLKNGNFPYIYPNVNWVKETFKDYGSMMNLNTNFKGGGNHTKYFVSLNYQNERGFLDNTTLDKRYDSQMTYDRFNFRSNLDIDVTRTTTLQVNVAGNIYGFRQPGTDVNTIVNYVYNTPSAAFPIRTSSGAWGGTEIYDTNPVAHVSSTGFRKPFSRAINSNMRLIQDMGKLVKGLSGEMAIAYDNRNSFWENKTRGFRYESVSVPRDPNTGEFGQPVIVQYGNDSDLNPSNSPGGQMRQTTFWGKLNYEKFWMDNELHASVMFEEDKKVLDGQYNTYLNQNIVATSSYSIKNKFFLEGALTYSGTNLLPKGNRFGFFPSVSGAWILSREGFFKIYKNISYLKLRASWGQSGNNRIGQNIDDQAFSAGGSYYFTDNNTNAGGIREGALANPNVTFEKASISNIGFELGLNNSLEITLDAFYELRSNILASSAGYVPSLIGVGLPLQNIGKVENKGLEVSLLWKEKKGDFSYQIGGKLSYAKNRILESGEGPVPYPYLSSIGTSIGQYRGLESEGFFKNATDVENSPAQLFSNYGPGDVKYKDQNGDGIIDQFDQVQIGNTPYPQLYYSSTLGIEYKKFGISALLQGVANRSVYLNTPSVFVPLVGNRNISTFYENSWTPENADNATLPRLTLKDGGNNYRSNDIWVRKGDYLKLRQLELFYSLPDQWLKKMSISSNRLFLRGMNLFSIDSIDVMDPESLGATYPSLTSYHVGINLGF